MRSLIALIMLLPGAFAARSQGESISLADCYALAEQHYPLARQRDLIARSRDFSLANISKGNLPQIGIFGQATYQSDVIRLPISFPGVDIPEMPKEQFRLYGEISQPLTDLITVRQTRAMEDISFNIRQQDLEAELYRLRERVNQLFFGALLIGEQIRQTELLKKDIATAMSRVAAAIDFGTELKSSLDKLKAELLKAEQRTIELSASRKAFLQMLSLFINRTLGENTSLEKPPGPAIGGEINRPELKAFDFQRQGLDIRNKLITARNLPKLGLFLQGGFGRPSPVNMLSEDLAPYYLGGLRLNWSLSAFYTSGKERELIAVSRDMIESQEQTFLFNTGIALEQTRGDMQRLQELIRTDDQIIALRISVKDAASVQLENGVITVNDFLREANAADQARQNKALHEMQLLMAQYSYQTTAGN